MTKPYRVLLYYKYVHIDDPETFTAEHLAFCKELGVKGRILISDEGINGTLSGTVEQTDRYMNALRDDPRFHDIFFKIDKADEHAFKKIFVYLQHFLPQHWLIYYKQACKDIHLQHMWGLFSSWNRYLLQSRHCYSQMKRCLSWQFLAGC